MSLARPAAQRRRFVLEAAARISPSVRHLVLRTEDGAPFTYLPGQWLKLYLPGLERDYSIASAPSPSRPDRVELIVTHVEGGAGSTALHHLPLGAALDTLGPNGLFVREDDERRHPALFVATGTGLAPLRAMIEDGLARGETAPRTLLFGARTEADLLFRAELEALAARGQLRYEPTLSRAGASWPGRRGHVQAHLRELVTSDAHVYICGLSRMITEVRAVLRAELGLPRTQVHSERYD
jgi:CDP-4-dehydro-6-deoxyglucose reductase